MYELFCTIRHNMKKSDDIGQQLYIAGYILRKLGKKYIKDPIYNFSAGVGRIGTFIAIDQLFDLVKNNKLINIHNIVLEMSKHRVLMVQSLVSKSF